MSLSVPLLGLTMGLSMTPTGRSSETCPEAKSVGLSMGLPKSHSSWSSGIRPKAKSSGLTSLGSPLYSGGYDPYEDDYYNALRGVGADKNSNVWEAIYQKDAMYIKMEMPGVSKDDVKVYLDDNNYLVIKGEAKPDPELEGDKDSTPKVYFARISIMLMKNKYQTATMMKAEMKNGVLKVKIPKINELMEREDVVYVRVD